MISQRCAARAAAARVLPVPRWDPSIHLQDPPAFLAGSSLAMASDDWEEVSHPSIDPDQLEQMDPGNRVTLAHAMQVAQT